MRLRGVPYVIVAVALGLTACGGCEEGAKERPIRFVSRDASAVLELRDLGLLAKSRDKLASAVAAMIPAEQLTALERELTLSLGFNPATEAGLAEAGLPKEGPIAVELVGGGLGALWAVPVKDPARFEKVVGEIARARSSVESTEKVLSGTRELTLLISRFGPEEVVVAAYAFEKGTALIGAGRDARGLVERALARAATPGDDVTKNPEYAALERALPKVWDLRLIAPAPPASTSSVARAIARLGVAPLARAVERLPDLKGVQSTGFSLAFEPRALDLQGRVRLDAPTLAKARAVLSVGGPAPAGVRASILDDAVIALAAAGSPKMLLAELGPPGSPGRAELERAFARVKQDLGTDVEGELLPLLSGHAAVSLGLRSLSGLDLRRLVEDPRVLWMVMALGSSDPAKLFELEKRLDPGLVERGMTIGARRSGAAEVHTVGHVAAPDRPAEVLVETFESPGARVFSTESSLTDRTVERTQAPPADPLGGRAGVRLEVRFGVLSKALSALNLGALPVLYRAVAAKVLDLLRLLDRATLVVGPAEDGLELSGRVELAPQAAAAR